MSKSKAVGTVSAPPQRQKKEDKRGRRKKGKRMKKKGCRTEEGK